MWTKPHGPNKNPISLHELRCNSVGIDDKDMGRMRSYQEDPEKKNNALHVAVINGDLKEAEKILSSASYRKKYILLSAASKLNTPITLALKHGDINMAKLFLKQLENEDDAFEILNLKDCHGLTALDWACMLRNDEIIELILEHTPAIDSIDQDDFFSGDSYAAVLYKENLGSLEGFLRNIRPEKVDAWFAEMKSLPLNANAFYPKEPYSDTRYYMEPLCIRLGCLAKSDFKEAAKEVGSPMRFYKAFEIGHKAFTENRDKKPVNAELLKAMQSNDNLTDYLEKRLNSKKSF